MTTITEDYVSFETAKLLNNKGFNVPCRSYYSKGGVLRCGIIHCNAELGPINATSAPTLQMACKWLREVHHIIFVFKPSYFSGDECTYWTYERWCGDNFDGEVLSFKTYEKAVEAALKYCLENLI